MIDIHSHIFPGLDDGAKSMEDTLGIVRQLYHSGFQTVIGTPHVWEGSDYLSPEEILAAADQVNLHIAEAGIPVKILPGAENYICPDMGRMVREGKLMTLGNTGKYLLLELPMLEIPQYTEQVFFDLQVQGLIPVLAHPERNKGLIDRPDYLIEWANKGILFQLNLRSSRGRYGPQSQNLAETMLRSNLIHFVGSDAHRPSGKDSVYLEALEELKDVSGETRYGEVTQMNPQRVIDGETWTEVREYRLERPVVKKKSRFWSLFRK